MGAKFSKAGKGDKCNDGVVDESSDTFDKTSTLPATFKKKDEEANKAGTLPRGGLDRSTSFSKRFRKSMTRLVGHKKINENAKPSSEPNELNAGLEGVEEEGNNKTENETTQGLVEIQEVVEDDVKTAQLKARAQFFEDMYNSKEPANIPKPPRSNIPSPAPIEKVNEEDDEVETVSVSVIGTPVVKLIEKHEEEMETQQETPELNKATDDADVEVVDKIVNTQQEMVTPAESKQAELHEAVNEQSEVQLVNDNSGETMTAEPVEQKIIESVTESPDTKDEVIVTCTANEAAIEQDTVVLLESEQKAEHPEKVECEDNHDKSQTDTIEGVNSQNEVREEEPKCEEGFTESTQEEKVEEIDHEKPVSEKEVTVLEDACPVETISDVSEEREELEKPVSEKEVPVLEDACPVETNSDVSEEKEELDMHNEDSEDGESLNEQNTNLHKEDEKEQIATENEEKRENAEINTENETFEIVTSDMINDIEESGAASLESKCDSRIDDLSSEGGSEGGITTDEGIVASDDEEKEKEEDPKFKLDITDEPKSLAPLTENSEVAVNE